MARSTLEEVRNSVDVKLFEDGGELYVLAKSTGRQAKETAMRRKRLARLLRKLRAMRHTLPSRDQLLMRIGAAKTAAGRAFRFVQIDLPPAGQAVTRQSFRFRVDKAKLHAAQLRDGHYLLTCCGIIGVLSEGAASSRSLSNAV